MAVGSTARSHASASNSAGIAEADDFAIAVRPAWSSSLDFPGISSIRSSARASGPASVRTVSSPASRVIASTTRCAAEPTSSGASMSAEIPAMASARISPGMSARTRSAAARAAAPSPTASNASASACAGAAKCGSSRTASRQAAIASRSRPNCHNTSPRWNWTSGAVASARAAWRKHSIASTGRPSIWCRRPRAIHSAYSAVAISAVAFETRF